ncbi:hypothetical protein [Streptomyces sp. NPDC057557]
MPPPAAGATPAGAVKRLLKVPGDEQPTAVRTSVHPSVDDLPR